MKEYIKLTQRGAREEFSEALKEYIKVKEYLKLTGIGMEGYSWCLGFCKDSKLNIMHWGKDKPAFIWSNGFLSYFKNGKVIKHEQK
jgi:hypothetical protein